VKVDKRKLYHLDWYLIANGLGLFAIGIFNLVSATSSFSISSFTFIIKQLVAFSAGMILIFVIIQFDYRVIASHWKWFYAGSLGFILLVLIIGMAAGGARRWISIYGISFQPSEFIKPILVLVLAHLLYEKKREHKLLGLKDVGIPLLVTVVPLFFIIIQPDLGTGVTIFLTCLAMLWFVGMKKMTYAAFTTAAIIGPVLLWRFGLKPYQKLRILTWLGLETDPQGVGYHVKQATIAVGSGGFFGKGYLSGTQHKLHFIPEHHTDFIFTVFSEEWGFFGSVALFLLFISFIHRCIKISLEAHDELGSLIAFGIASVFYFQFSINVLMAIHLAPVVGIPLPFISYGGSSLISVLASAGLLLNVSMRRYMF
jgi:rod shape determining protein RodA